MTTKTTRPDEQTGAGDKAGEGFDTRITARSPLVTLARRWRDLRLGCPSGCPLDHHAPPCHLGEEVAS